MPVSSFMEGLLYYYKIQLHHLTPNSVLHISVFVHFCEAFLGIRAPQYWFCGRPLAAVDAPMHVGLVGCARSSGSTSPDLLLTFM